jgi:hypothetical protein
MADRRTTKEAAGSKDQLKERSIDRKGDQEATLWSFVEREAVEVQLLDKNIAWNSTPRQGQGVFFRVD